MKTVNKTGNDDRLVSVDEYLCELERLEKSFCEPSLAYCFWEDMRCACDHCIELRNKIAAMKIK